ncbi:MAG: lysozyme [Verrucomicrobiaceae bacterium]|nr:lysozyme [Verrucomicrobiaceae bacterium]
MSQLINAATLALVKHFEGLYLEAYQCTAGIWTIGYGHTGLRHNDGTVRQGRKITAQEAEQLLARDLEIFAAGVSRLLLPKVAAALNENQFGALVSFAFNLGLANLSKSTLIQRINALRWKDCPAEFLKWNRASGRILRGLTRRRQSEANLFQSKEPWLVKP